MPTTPPPARCWNPLHSNRIAWIKDLHAELRRHLPAEGRQRWRQAGVCQRWTNLEPAHDTIVLTAMNDWHILHDDIQYGPFSSEQVIGMVADGSVDPHRDHAWKEGMESWLPLMQCGFAPAAATAPSRVAAQAAPPPWNPYGPPLAAGGLTSQHPQARFYGGIGRLRYGLTRLLLTVVLGIIVMVAHNTPGIVDFAGLVTLVALVAAGVTTLYVMNSRLQNVGMSVWCLLLLLVPLADIWVSWRMIACPEGYSHHRKLDTAGVVMTVVMAGLVALSIVFLALLSSAARHLGF